MPSQSERRCLECGAPFKGRVDKKFCSDTCRVAFNNRLNSDDTSYVRNINNILRKNRRILISMNPTGKNKVSYDKLKARGFDFNHFTSTYKRAKARSTSTATNTDTSPSNRTGICSSSKRNFKKHDH